MKSIKLEGQNLRDSEGNFILDELRLTDKDEIILRKGATRIQLKLTKGHLDCLVIDSPDKLKTHMSSQISYCVYPEGDLWHQVVVTKNA